MRHVTGEGGEVGVWFGRGGRDPLKTLRETIKHHTRRGDIRTHSTLESKKKLHTHTHTHVVHGSHKFCHITGAVR